MKSGFHLYMLKPKSSQSSGRTRIHQTSRKKLLGFWTYTPSSEPFRIYKSKSLNKLLPESWWQLFSGIGLERSADDEIHAKRDNYNVRRSLRSTKKNCRAIRNKRRGMLTSGVVLLHDNARPHTAARSRALLEHFNWEFFWLPSLQPWSRSERLPPIHLPEEMVMITALQQKWEVDGRCQNIAEITGERLLWRRYKETHSPPKRNVSIPAVTKLRSSLSMYIFFVCNNILYHSLFC
jgi:hypothetical protein